MLKLGAIVNFILAVAHLACLPFLDVAFKIYGVNGIMNEISAKYGAAIPYVATVFIALAFFVCGLYALSALGKFRKLPLLKIGIFIIAAVFLLRAVWGVTMLVKGFSWLEVSSTAVSALIGLCYLLGGIKIFKSK